MHLLVDVLQKIIPKETEVLKRRYAILVCVDMFQPIGRRSISQRLSLSEKIVRTDTEFLSLEGYLEINAAGMRVTAAGEAMIIALKDLVDQLDGLNTMKETLKQVLGCEQLIIVPGNVDDSVEAVKHMARMAADELRKHLQPEAIVALTGGGTIYQVVQAMKNQDLSREHITIVPARGSLGNTVDYQANTLVSVMAKKLDCQFRLLNIPDNLSPKALESVRQEPEIQSTIDEILKANVLLYGIGNVFEMAKRRNLDQQTVALLQERGAVAEVLGYYCNQNGDVVYTSSSIGVTLDEMKSLKVSIAVACGAKKARAILAVARLISKGTLIIDEGAAKGILELQNHGEPSL